MNSIAFGFGSIQVHWYRILVAAATGISYWLTRRNIRFYGMDPDQTDGFSLN